MFFITFICCKSINHWGNFYKAMKQKYEIYKKELVEHQKELKEYQKELQEQLQSLREIRQKLKTQQEEAFFIDEMLELKKIEESENLNLNKIFSFVFEKIWK